MVNHVILIFDSAYEDYKITPNTSKISKHPIVNNKYFKAMLESRFIEDKIEKEGAAMIHAFVVNGFGQRTATLMNLGNLR